MPNVITNEKIVAGGNYVVAFLDAGTYDLVAAEYNCVDFGEVLGFIADLQVQSE